MKENGFLPWERVLAACEGEEIVGFCTLSQKDELPENLPYAPFIGFVFVEERYRGRRISEKMIDRAALCENARLSLRLHHERRTGTV